MNLSLPDATGNAMINNALITIKQLAGVETTSALTTEVLRKHLLRISNELPYPLMDLNLRFKSYTMLFSKNGPLLNDKQLGKKIYQQLLLKIIDHFENKGSNMCILSGMQYNKSFSEFYSEVLKDLKVSEAEIKKRDLTINRCWFPLLGGLGSDAQSLPMAKYAYDIHPIFIVILQFLPLSSLLFKGGILLVDSSNRDFNEKFIKRNLNEVTQRSLGTSVSEPIENIKDFSKGNYLLQSLDIMELMNLEYGYIDIHLWSFSNSGTGASCEIDRLPNLLLKRLRTIYLRCRKELTSILRNTAYATSFIKSLENSTEWYGLYPSKKWDGVSVEFFETYWKVLDMQKETEIAKYIAYLISIYKSKSFEKILSKPDAHSDSNYQNELNTILLGATRNGEWNLHLQLYIQTDKDSLPITAGYWHLLRLIHFYFYKQEFTNIIPIIETVNNTNAQIIKWVLSLIENDSNKTKIAQRLCDGQNYSNVVLSELFIRHLVRQNIDIFQIFSILYDKNGKARTLGILSLLRFYYLEPTNCKSILIEETELPATDMPEDFKSWILHIHKFVEDYIHYRLDKIMIEEKRQEYLAKIIDGIPRTANRQRVWLGDIINKLNKYNQKNSKSNWTEEGILYDPLGNYNSYMAIFTFRMKITELTKLSNLQTINK